jgi:hypothetical protein
MTIDEIKLAITQNQYVWYDAEFRLNIVSFRNPKTGHKVTNQFDDLLTLSYKAEGGWVSLQYPVTVDPGRKPMLSPSNPKGCAVLVTGQYVDAYTVRLHKNRYAALCQRYDRTVRVYRDNSKDLIYHLDNNTIEAGSFGINIHSAGLNSVQVDGWSEGCTVFKRKKDFLEFMTVVNRSKDLYGNAFTYTLI